MESVVRIAIWNIGQKAHDVVADTVTDLQADVLVIPEIARPLEAADRFGASDVCHVGTDETSRLAVFTFGDYRCELDGSVGSDPENDLMWNLPVLISGPVPFRLLAVWSDNFGNLRPTTKAIECLTSDWVDAGPVVVAGDFNHYRKRDHVRDNDKDHGLTVERLAELGLTSAYHRSRGLDEAKDLEEADPTFWMHGHESKPHHLDYIYAPVGSIRPSPDSVVVGTHAAIPQKKLSDHAHLVADLDL